MKKPTQMYEYDYSFLVGDKRIRRQIVSPHIHNVIETTRKEFPTAMTFIVIEKVACQGVSTAQAG